MTWEVVIDSPLDRYLFLDPIREAQQGRSPRTANDEAGSMAGWLDAWQPEDGPLIAARQRAAEAGVDCVDPTTGAALRFLAAAASARAVVEFGTGAGVSALWLLRGMRPDGILTSVDAEPEHHRLAKQMLTEAGVPAGRVRLIGGRALEVAARLTDGAYDLVVCDADRAQNADYLSAALRLLRVGGLVVFIGALNGGTVAEPTARDADTLALRDLGRIVREESRLVPAMFPIGAGLLVAALVEAPVHL